MSRYSGSSVDSPMETETAMGKNEIMKAMSTVVEIVLAHEQKRHDGHHRGLGNRVEPHEQRIERVAHGPRKIP